MQNWAYKFLGEIQLTFKSYCKILRCILMYIGGFFTFSEILNQVFQSTWGIDFLRNNFIILLLILTGLSLIINWKKLYYEYFLKGEDIKISLVVGDILNSGAAIVIPTNTTFDTMMDGEFISVNSIQGQFQNKFYKNNLAELDSKIDLALQGVEFSKIQDNRPTKTKRYPIGTTCKLSIDNFHYYFIAIADINVSGKPENTSLQNITLALENLWQTINQKGHIENLAIPLIGTGKAGIKDASRDKIVQEIIFSFIASAKEMKVTEKLEIFIHPQDFKNKNFHWRNACSYLNYMCKFRYIEKSTKTEGQAESITTVATFG